MDQGTQPATTEQATDQTTNDPTDPGRDRLADLRAFVAADPVEFTETGNQVREERIEAALDKLAAAAETNPDAALVTFVAERRVLSMPRLTVDEVIRAQREAALILAWSTEARS